jgi:HrpA-like RNA helicase
MNPETVAVHLPIADYRLSILSTVAANQVTIIVAETGAGKSTQVPQYLASDGYQKVIVTQPRILAARNLSRRVREEWTLSTGKDNDEFVAYRTAHERDDTPNTTILYCTDGLQLVREITGAGTTSRQILVLDEVHEWNENMEVLVAWAKKRCQEDPGFKVVVMSATIEADKLATYFETAKPVIVPGRMHEVVKKRGHDIIDSITKKLLSKTSSNMLVFLPGKAEIESVASLIKTSAAKALVPVIPLHGQLDAEAQQLAFLSYPNGKIVLSTNVAQTSVTIEDIDVVIDSGLERRSDVKDGVEGLFIAQTSQADCLQRAGRAGRTKKGEYILVPLDDMPCLDFDERPAYAIPEIMRKHIDRLTLRLASVGIDIEELEFYHAPSTQAIKAAKQTLRTLGAIGKDGTVTSIGRKMERFPVESSYARMLVEAEGYDKSVQVKLAAIIAIQEVGGIIKGGTRFTGWRRFTNEKQSDLLAQYDVYLMLPTLLEDEYEDLGIIEKNTVKAREVMVRLAHDSGLEIGALEPITIAERVLLLRSIVVGQIDQMWVIDDDGAAVHILKKQRRELSSSTVVTRPRLIVGTPFDLQIPTAKGLEVLHLVQSLTSVDPRWLESLAPHLFIVRPGKLYFDSQLHSLAQRQLVTYNGKVVDGMSTPILEPTPRNRQLFVTLYAKLLYEKLERERRTMQHGFSRTVPQVPLRDVEQRVRQYAEGAMSLDELSSDRRRELRKTGEMKTYLDEKSLSRLSGVRSSPRREQATHRGWQPRHKRKYDRYRE